MDSRVDFALDRGRLLAPNLPPGSGLGPMTSFGNDLSRAGVTELARTATPATMSSLAQYQSRFLPSTMSMHSPGEFGCVLVFDVGLNQIHFVYNYVRCSSVRSCVCVCVCVCVCRVLQCRVCSVVVCVCVCVVCSQTVCVCV